MVDAAAVDSAVAVVCTVPRMPAPEERSPDYALTKRRYRLNELIVEKFGEDRVVDTSSLDAFEEDGLHLTKKGYAELAKLIYPVCRAAMKRCRPSKKTAAAVAPTDGASARRRRHARQEGGGRRPKPRAESPRGAGGEGRCRIWRDITAPHSRRKTNNTAISQQRAAGALLRRASQRPVPPVDLYFACAASPNVACQCMSRDRTWTSTNNPSRGRNSVEWSDR